MKRTVIACSLPVALAACGGAPDSSSPAGERRRAARRPSTLLNVSYDPTRELYQEFNAAFAKYWQARPGRPSRFGSRTAAPALRRARSSTASRPTS